MSKDVLCVGLYIASTFFIELSIRTDFGGKTFGAKTELPVVKPPPGHHPSLVTVACSAPVSRHILAVKHRSYFECLASYWPGHEFRVAATLLKRCKIKLQMIIIQIITFYVVTGRIPALRQTEVPSRRRCWCWLRRCTHNLCLVADWRAGDRGRPPGFIVLYPERWTRTLAAALAAVDPGALLLRGLD